MRAASYLLAAIVFAAASASPAATVTLFHETFDGNLQNWSYTSTAARNYDNIWNEENAVKPGYKGIKLGSTSDTGSITSEFFSLGNTTESVSITIVAAAYSNNGGGKEGIVVTVYDSSDAVVFSSTVVELTQHTSTAMDEIPTTAAYTKVFTVPAASLPSSGEIHLKIESTYTKTGQRRALLGDVLVTQTVSSGVNTPPAATQPSVDVDATVGTAAEVDLSDYFTDADGDSLTYALDTGVGAVSGSIWSFTPDSTGSFSAEVSATDPSGDSAPLYIAVTAVLPSLSAPTFEPVRPEDATADGFVLRWMPIAGAVAYELSVTNAATGMGVGATVAFSIPSGPDPDYVVATVSDLDPDTTYEVAARALATTDPSFPSLDYSDSDWSTPVEIATTLEGGLLRAVLLDEGFSGADNAWSNPSAKPGDAETDCDSWSFSANSYNARSAIKIGSANSNGAVGWALSPEITLSNEVASATVDLSFSAASYPNTNNKRTTATISIIDAATGETNAIAALTAFSPAALGNTSSTEWSGGTDYAESVTVPTRFKLLFETISSASDKRLLLDSIKITQVYDPNFAALSAPTGVAGSDIGKHGFTVSWTGVANATGYEVWLDGAVAGSCASTDTSMSLTGLSDGTEYSVQAKALGDNLHFGDSPLSPAISVTTLADAQKIDFTVTGAPAGDVFAGDAVAFTVTAETESTHAAAEVSFSGIAGATFTAATGAFSWTPTEGDVGSHTATFTSGDYSTNVTITVISALKTETLFHETFAKCEKKWIGTSTEMTDAMADEANWTFSEHCYSGTSGLRIGLKEAPNYGLAMTRLIEPKQAGTVSLSFRAAGNAAGSTMTVTSAGGATFSQTVTLAAFSSDDAPIPDEAGYVFGPYDIVATGGFSLSFTPASGDGRMGVDEILVTQTVSARIPDLPAPTGLAVEEGSVATNGFSVSWSVVSDATNYAVRVTDAAGSVVFSAPFCATTSAAVTGLADDEAYAVQVRATGDEAICFASPWSDALAVRTARSATHPTLSFGAWQNAVGDGKVHGGLLNTASVTAVRDNGTNAVVTLASVLPAPTVGPTLEDGVLSWIPADADTNKTFTVSFLMDGTYATNLSFKVRSVPFLQAPEAEAVDVAWNSFGLSWNRQLRAAGYAVRAWTDCPNPNATATRIEEYFAGYAAGVRPADWVFHCATGSSGFYKDDKAPVKLSESTHDLETYDLGGAISSVSFHAAGHSISNSTSTLTVVGIKVDGTETVLATLTATDIGQTDAGIDRTYSVPAGVRRIAWRYTKDKGGVGVGSVVIEGTGFSTPRWLPGWGPAEKNVGLVQACTVAKPRPGKALGVDPADKTKDLEAPRINYAEVTVRDAAGAALATVVAVKVPAPPRSARATLMILK